MRWILQPSGENQAAAQAASEGADPLSPAAALAFAAGQTGAGARAAAQSVAKAVKLLSVKAGDIAKRQRSYVELGMEVARGKFL